MPCYPGSKLISFVVDNLTGRKCTLNYPIGLKKGHDVFKNGWTPFSEEHLNCLVHKRLNCTKMTLLVTCDMTLEDDVVFTLYKIWQIK